MALGEHGMLAGSYRPAEDGAPVMLIIPGSGPINRNGHRPPALGDGVYRKLAREMEARGISTLRFDKRGSYLSLGAIRNTDDLRIEGYARDARIWVERAIALSRASCIWLFGHSEGGLVASVLLREDNAKICGLILAAAPGRSIDLVLHDQLTAYTRSKRALRKIREALAELKAGREIDESALPLVIRGLFNPVNQRFFIDWMRYEPTEVISDYGGPVLIIQGTEDFRIRVSDAETLAAALPNAELAVFDGVNHNFSETDLTFPPPDIALSREVMDRLARFMGKELTPSTER